MYLGILIRIEIFVKTPLSDLERKAGPGSLPWHLDKDLFGWLLAN